MRIRIIKSIILALGLVFLSSCSNSVGKPISISEKAAPVSMTGYTPSSYKVYTKKSVEVISDSEPLNGCYIGVYTHESNTADLDMLKFDELTDKSHSLSVYKMKLGETFPYEWVLECIAAMKTPYIIIYPPNEYSVFQEELLNAAAKEFSELFVPIFVDFYPDPHKYTTDSKLYVDFYKMAYDAFKVNAPNTTFVLSADSEHVYDFDFYYPGDDYVDWLGINIYMPVYKNGALCSRSYMKDLDFFYTAYQHKKPISISQLAVSSYSTFDNKYCTNEASKKITDFYANIKNYFPRIKAINYMDVSYVDKGPKKAVRDNFSVTYSDKMLSSYTKAVNDAHFLSDYESYGEKTGLQMFKSSDTVYEDENDKYISEQTLVEMGISPESPTAYIDGLGYYSLRDIGKYGVLYTLNPEINTIILEQ